MNQPQSSFLAQIQIDEQAVICPYCEQPLDGAAGVRYGHETLHVACHVALGHDFDLVGQEDDGLIFYDEHPDVTDAQVVELMDRFGDCNF